MSVRLYVKLPKAEIEKEGFEKMFSEFETSFSTKLIRERKKKECRGFGFVTVPDDQAAEDFINRYNEKPFVYDGEPYKDEDGNDFVLLIEKALPRKSNKEQGEENVETTTAQDENSTSKSRSNNNKKAKKNRPGKTKTPKNVSVAQSAQPDPRWADELNKLKEMFATQTSK